MKPRQKIAMTQVMEYILEHELEDFEDCWYYHCQDDKDVLYHHVYYEALILKHGRKDADKIVKELMTEWGSKR